MQSHVFSVLCATVLLSSSLSTGGVLRIVPQTCLQPDGAWLQCLASGDEFYHWLHDTDNFAIVQNLTTGQSDYAVLSDGAIVPSECVVDKCDHATVGFQSGLDGSSDAMNKRRDVRLRMLNRTTPARPYGASSLNDIVIFIRFADESAEIFPDSLSSYESMFNSPAPGANSMYNYYQEVSYGKFSITATFYPHASDSVLSFQDQNPRNYYRSYNAITNPVGYTSDTQADIREQELLKRAIEAVTSQIPTGVDFDLNGDGNIDNVTFVISGDPDAWSEWVLWPHSWELFRRTAVINGRRVRTYDVQFRGYLMRDTGGVLLLCHEMFHCLGAPDLYDYVNHGTPSERFPMWIWDLMGEKNPPNRWLNPPPHMCAYMKYKYGGWIDTIPTISMSGTYTISPLTSPTNNCYKIPSPFSSSEFFVVEYRKRSGTFESSLPGEGLLVYRINTQRFGNAGGPPYEVYVYRPGGTLLTDGTPDSACFSGNSGRVTITDSTNPSSFLSDGSPGGLKLTRVGILGDKITFTIDFPDGIVEERQGLPTTYSLAQGYPNPFNPSTTIRYGLPSRAHVTLTVYNTLGQQVSVLQNGEQDAGYHEVRFDSANLSSGIYFYRMQAGSFTETKKLLLVR